MYLEVDGVERFGSVERFHSYCRLVPGSSNSAGKQKHKRSKDGNRYLKLAFSHATVRAIQYYPEIRSFYQSRLRKKNKMIARALVATEIARIVYFTLHTREPYDGKFKGEILERTKIRAVATPGKPGRLTGDCITALRGIGKPGVAPTSYLG